jgi:predicted metal-dependent HD superfamily phosphohydrolase
VVEKVAQMILLTKHHNSISCDTPENIDTALFLDFDMSILGADWVVYAEYAGHIRVEYRHVPQNHYCLARAAVLEKFLQFHSIYSTSIFQAQYEQSARLNLAHEIQLLQQQLDVS